MFPIGFLVGILSPISQSFSYLFSRQYLSRPRGDNYKLLALAHTWMMVFAFILLPFVYDKRMLRPGAYLLPLFGASFSYLAAQGALFFALARENPSRVSPLLAFKILVLAGIMVLFEGEAILPLQMVSITLCIAAALLLNYSSGRVAPASLAGIILACVFYSLSDYNISLLVACFPDISPFRAALAACAMCYILTGAVGLLMLLRPGLQVSWMDFKSAFPFALFWFTAMLFLFSAIRMVGVILAIILQSLRGIFSIVIIKLLKGRGMEHLEQDVSRIMFFRRLIGAVMMSAAVALYVLA